MWNQNYTTYPPKANWVHRTFWQNRSNGGNRASNETAVDLIDQFNLRREYIPILHGNLTFHQINNDLFSDMMRNSVGYVSTAGFESICEAMYLRKPTLMIPVAGQYEQACNAIDAETCGAGVQDITFNISRLLEFIPEYRPNNDFKNWTDQTEKIFLEELTNF